MSEIFQKSYKILYIIFVMTFTYHTIFGELNLNLLGAGVLIFALRIHSELDNQSRIQKIIMCFIGSEAISKIVGADRDEADHG